MSVLLNYNVNWSNVTGVYDVVKIANDSTNSALGTGFVMALFFIMLISLKSRGYELDESLSASAWVCFVIALLARFAELVSLYLVIIFLIIAAGISFYMGVTKHD